METSDVMSRSIHEFGVRMKEMLVVNSMITVFVERDRFVHATKAGYSKNGDIVPGHIAKEGQFRCFMPKQEELLS